MLPVPQLCARRVVFSAVVTFATLGVCLLAFGCNRSNTPPIIAAMTNSGTSTPPADSEWTARSSDVLRMQSEVMDFADDFTLRLGDVVDRIEAAEPPMRGRMLSHKLRVRTAQGAVAIAASNNPLVAQADMLVMVTLQRSLLETAFEPADFEIEWDALVRVFVDGEQQMRAIAARSFTAEQLIEVDASIKRWLGNNPGRRFATGVRLEDFAATRQTTVTESNGRSASVFSLLRIDPLSGLNPTNREIEQSRLLAERAFFYVQRAPQLFAWQTELLLLDSLAEREVQTLVRSADQISTAAADLTAQTGELKEQLPGLVAQERQAAIEQASDRLAVEREAAINQAFDRLATERTALLDEITAREAELNATMTNLRETMTAAESLVASSRELAGAIDGLAVRLGFDDEPSGEPGTTIDDYNALLARAESVVSETTKTIEAIDRLAASDAWDERADTIETISIGLEDRVGGLIRLAFRYALILVLVVLGGTLLVGVTLRRIRPAKLTTP